MKLHDGHLFFMSMMEAAIPVIGDQIPEVATVASAAAASPMRRSSGNRTSARK
jgi:hypothetical protein